MNITSNILGEIIIRDSFGRFKAGTPSLLKGKKAKPNSGSFTKGQSPWNKGKNISGNSGRSHSIESRIKIGLPQKGSLNHQWRGGITPLRGQIYNLLQWRIWRESIFERDNFICVSCKTKGGRLEADHIKAFSTILKENKIKTTDDAINCSELWDISNGRTLCRPCHIKTENYGNRKKI